MRISDWSSDVGSSDLTNLCTAIRATQGKGVMPDGTSRFSYKGQAIFHYMGCSTFSNFTVLPEIAVAKIREDAPFKTSCYIGCEIGRASCRERVCQYVYISVVAVSLKKKETTTNET